MSLFKKDKHDVTINLTIKAVEEVSKPVEAAVKPDPIPDLSTKPKDIKTFCFGFVCPEHHITDHFQSITVEGFKERRACSTCGLLAKPAIIKRIAEAIWGQWYHYRYPDDAFSWMQYDRTGQPFYTSTEFVSFLK